jgi:hypothetical protein
MKKTLITLIILNSFAINFLYSDEYDSLKFYGETNYTKSSSENLNTILKMKYKMKIFEPKHKKYIVYLKGSVDHDYDVFGKDIKLNGFTTFCIDF